MRSFDNLRIEYKNASPKSVIRCNQEADPLVRHSEAVWWVRGRTECHRFVEA